MSMSDHPTKVKPLEDDYSSLSVLTEIPNILPGHVLEVKSSYHKRGPLKNIDKNNRTCYLKLDCKILKNGKIVQTFNRFILLNNNILDIE